MKNNKTPIYKRPSTLTENRTHYCAGCGHGIIHKLLAQAIETLKIAGKTIIMAPVGCSVLLYKYIKVDGIEAAHGRAPAVATGIKRSSPDKIIISYQGDGDLMAIGTGETLHAANRGENISVIFVNNGVYGMTGGQLAPTTLLHQKTKTSPLGRDETREGYPMDACKLINNLQAPYYIERCSVHDIENIRKTKNAIMKLLKNQVEGKGYSFLEILSMCPTAWGLTPVKATQWIKENVTSVFPIQIFRNEGKIINA